MSAGGAVAIGARGATLLVLVSALLWGVWWAPIRWIEAGGISGLWGGVLMNLGGALALGGLALARAGLRDGLLGMAPRQFAGAVLVGVAVTLYAGSLSLTEVVRAVLLFYLAPAWATAIEVLFMGRRFSWKSVPALGFSLAGLVTILGGEVTLGIEGAGDMMALGSGLAWAAGSALVFSTPAGAGTQIRPEGLAATTMLAAVATGLVLALAWGSAVAAGHGGSGAADAGAGGAGGTAWTAILLALAIGALYLAPIIFIALWGAMRLPPATMSFLLTAEILSGVGTSALFLDERFGWLEGLGAVLVTLGATLGVAAERDSGADERR